MAPKRKNRQPRYVTIGTVGLVLLGGYIAYRTKTPQRTTADYSRGILSYAAQPHFISADFLEQLTGTPAKLELYDCKEDPAEPRVYFSIPEEHRAAVVAKITWRPDRVEDAPTFQGRQVLGPYALRKPGWQLVRFADTNFRVDPQAQLAFPFRSAAYTVTADELLDWIENKSIYGGYLDCQIGRTWFGITVLSNHGALVAVAGEPSLSRLVRQLTADLTEPEAVAQRLLDFVTLEIAYDGREAAAEFETLKRASEVLMSGQSDCSGLAILYASLLEQTGIDYRLLYLPGHIAVGVSGNFPNDNDLAFRIQGQVMHVAETTAQGFRIGLTTLERAITAQDIRYLQRPARRAAILDAATGRPLQPDE